MKPIYLTLFLLFSLSSSAQEFGFYLSFELDTISVNCSRKESYYYTTLGAPNRTDGDYCGFDPSTGKFRAIHYENYCYYNSIGLMMQFECLGGKCNDGRLGELIIDKESPLSFNGVEIGSGRVDIIEVFGEPDYEEYDAQSKTFDIIYDLAGNSYDIRFILDSSMTSLEEISVMFKGNLFDSIWVAGMTYNIQKRYKNGLPKQVGNKIKKCSGKNEVLHSIVYRMTKEGDIKSSKEYYYGKKLNTRLLGLKKGLWLEESYFAEYILGIQYHRFKLKPCF